MIRRMQRKDLKDVMLIEQAVHLTPWPISTFEACLQAGCIAWVVIEDERVVGFILISVKADECHILNLAMMHAYQRRGFARQLLCTALEYARYVGMEFAYLEVRRSNKSAILLYTQIGFCLVGERKGYYPLESGHEDALIYAIKLGKV